MILEYNREETNENEKSKIQVKLLNIDEKIQALGKLFYKIHY